MNHRWMIEATDLSRRFGEKWAVAKVSFCIAPGEVVGFLGPNGAGKTTTMRMLTGFLPPSQGEIIIEGRSLAKEALAARQLVGYLPEAPPLYPQMRVASFLRFVAKIKGVARGRVGEAVDRALERCQLTEHRDRIIGNLSKGLRQRVGIAQAIVHEPPLLILDEPTVGLDPTQVAEIRRLIADLSSPLPGARAHSVILSTHILPEVEAICRRIILLCEGQMRIDTALADLLAQGHSLETVFAREVGGERLASAPMAEVAP